MLKYAAIKEIDILVERYPALQPLYEAAVAATEMMAAAVRHGGQLLVCGNGGSAADSVHIVGELMKSFVLPRKLPSALQERLKQEYPKDAAFYIEHLQQGVPAISLVTEIGLTTAFGNDCASELAFAQQVLGYGKKGDVLIAISTSGNSGNVLHAVKIARTLGLHVVSLTGAGGGKLKELSDILLDVPSKITYQIQEYHLPIYHALCLALETELFGED